jgi:peptide/nickel transport system substrate-binding protein
LLAEAGFVEGTKIQLLILSVLTSTIPMAEVIKEQLAEVGIEIEIVQRDIATFVQEYAIDFTAMLTITWYAGFSDPYLFLLNFRAGATGPFVGAQDTTQIDPLLAEVSVLTDPEARVAKFREIETLVANEAYFQFLATRNNFVAWRKDLLQGVTILPSDGFGLPYWHQIQDVSVTQ